MTAIGTPFSAKTVCAKRENAENKKMPSKHGTEGRVTAMVEYSNDVLLGSAIQLIKDIEHISFLGERIDCIRINHMAKAWLKRLEGDGK